MALHSRSSSKSDWDDEFADVEKAVVGFQIDRTTKIENWEDDFDLSSEDGTAPVRLTQTAKPLIRQPSSLSSSLGKASSSMSAHAVSKAAHPEYLQLLDRLKGLDYDIKQYEMVTRRSGLPKESSNDGTDGWKDAELPDISKELEFLEWRLAFANGKQDVGEEASVLLQTAQLYRSVNKLSDAMEQLEKALALVRSLGTVPLSASLDSSDGTGPLNTVRATEARCLHEMGLTAHAQQRSISKRESTARSYFLGSLQVVDPVSEIDLIISNNFHLGCMAKASGDNNGAIKYLSAHIRALMPMLETHRGPVEQLAFYYKQLSSSCWSIATAMAELDQLDIAVEMHKKAFAAACMSGEDEAKNETCEALKAAAKALTLAAVPTTAAGARDNEEEIEDWDLDLELEQRPVTINAQNIKNLLREEDRSGESGGTSDSAELPRRYRFVRVFEEKNGVSSVHIIRYPKPPTLYSFQKHESWKQVEPWSTAVKMANDPWMLISWINRLLNSRGNAYMQSFANPQLPHEFHAKCLYVDKYSSAWASLYLAHTLAVYRANKRDECWITIQEYFAQGASCRSPSDLDEEEKIERRAVFQYTLRILLVAAKLWQPSTSAVFKSFFVVARKIGAPNCIAVDLLEAELLGHVADSLPPDSLSKIAPSLCALYDVALSWQQRQPELNAPAGSLAACAGPGPVTPTQLQAAVLTDLHLYLTGFSPLTCGPLRGNTARDPETEANEVGGTAGRRWMEQKLRSVSVSSLPEIYSNEELRMDILLQLYPSLSALSYSKAKAAYALAMHQREIIGDCVLAEQLLFECLFILDHCEVVVPGAIPMVSELAQQSLLLLGEVLLDNYKYKYAIEVFEAAIMCYKLRKKKDFHHLNRRLAQICADNDDWRRSLQFYLKVLEKSREDKKINEFVFVSERISDMFLDHGDFKSAEDYLQAACTFVLPKHRGSNTSSRSMSAHDALRIDAQYLHLQLKIAQLYMQTFAVEKAIQVLQVLAAATLPHGKRATVLTWLVKAYLKKRWFNEAAETLVSLEEEEKANSAKSALAFGGQKNNFVAMAKARNLLSAGRYSEALTHADSSLESETRLGVLGQVHYLRGKIMQALCPPSNSVPVPLTLGEPSKRNPEPKHYNCSWDIVKDCIEAFHKAYEYFRKVEDDIRVAKTVTRIATVYLEQLFPRFALCEVPLDRLIRLPSGQLPFWLTRGGKLSVRPRSDQNLKRLAQEDHSKKLSTASNSGSEHGGALDDDEDDDRLQLRFKAIEDPATLGLEISVDTSHLLLLLTNYMNMAELRFLEGKTTSALSFWLECRDLFFSMFVHDKQLLFSSSPPPGFMSRLYSILKRLTRFLFVCDLDFIRENLMLLDTYLAFQIDYERSMRRPFEVPSQPDSPDTSTLMENTIGRTLTRRPPPQSLHARASIVEEQSEKPAAISEVIPPKEAASKEGAGLRVWSALHRLRTNFFAFAKGKVTQEDLYRLNQACLRKLYKTNMAYRTAGDDPVYGVRYSGLWENKTNLTGMMYILHIDDLLVSYIPSSGYKCVQRFGGRNELPFDKSALVPQPALHEFSRMVAAVPEGTPPPATGGGATSTRGSRGKAHKEAAAAGGSSPPPSKELSVTLGEAATYLTPDMAGYLSTQITGRQYHTFSSNEDTHSRIVAAMGSAVFKFHNTVQHYVVSIQPVGGAQPSTVRAKQGFWKFGSNQSYASLRSTLGPALFLAASCSLQALPWEVIWKETPVIRTFSMTDILVARQKHLKEIGHKKPLVTPKLFCFYTSTHTFADEAPRKQHLLHDILCAFNHVPKACTSGRDVTSNIPFTIPIMHKGRRVASYRRKYRHLTFLDTAPLEGQPQDILSLIENMTSVTEHPVFFLTLADLVSANEAVIYLLRFRRQATLFFVPEDRMKFVCKFFHRMSDLFALKAAHDLYQQLMAAVVCLVQEHGIPVAVFHPPSPWLS